MYRHLIFVFFLMLFFGSKVCGQTIDELNDEITAISAVTPENEARLQTLMAHKNQDVSFRAKMRFARLLWMSGDLEKAEALLVSQTNDFDSMSRGNQIKLWFWWSEFENRRNNYVQSQEYSLKALELAQPDSDLLPRAYLGYGNVLRQQSKWLEAKKYLELAADAYRAIDDIQGLSFSLSAIGVMYTSLGDLVKAIEHLNESRLLVEQYGKAEDIAATYYNLGEVYQDSGELEPALEYYEKALVLDEEIGDVFNIGFDHLAISSILYELGRYTDALQNNLKAIDNFVEVKAPRELSRAYLKLAPVYEKLGSNDDRFQSLELAKTNADKTNTQVQRLAVDLAFGQYFYDEERFDDAAEALLKGLLAAEELSLDNKKRDAHEWLAKTYKQLNRVDDAYYHLLQARQLDLTLNTEDQREKLERYKRDVNLLEEQLKVSELQQKEAEQAKALQAQKAFQQRLYLVMLVVGVLLLAAVFVLWQRRKLSLLRVMLYEETLQQKNQLLADVSHELRTPLTALRLKVEALQHNLVDDVDASYGRLIDKISDINRMISDIYQLAQNDVGALKLYYTKEDAAQVIPEWVQEFADLVEANDLTWQINIVLPETLLVSFDKDRIKQVLANLISNSIAYTDAPGSVALSVKTDNDFLYFTLYDSAPGVSDEDLPKLFERLFRVEESRSRATGGCGLGLSICKSIIESHQGTIKAIPSNLGGLCIKIKLPLSQGNTHD